MIVMDRGHGHICEYFDSIDEAKAWAGCEDESITTADELEEWMTKENDGTVAHTFDEVE